ncbi:cupin domain-containing protein [Bacillus solimangrovi]|uniref:Acireductone dioxygenase n=1 Tax=Bacillus solimangrovi TaxID=1305675 RepID=A0A1E5LE82_9BACI|nr:cupin domain-containing protein [Bacillus solimangrovi]OEH92380.1 acireductone dioxygenase [Bacillus solimangrovi]
MAIVKVRNTGEVISGEENVKQFFDQFDVLYEHWDVEKLSEDLRGNCKINDSQKEEVLQVFDTDIRSLAERRGYKNWDVVVLNDQTPDLEAILKKFEKVHTHTEDEVRAITAGSGTFIIKGDEQTGYFDVDLTAGDVISVPENTPHFFTLSDERQVVAVRLFIDQTGWVAHPYEEVEQR